MSCNKRKRPASRENNENSVYLSTRQDPAIVHSVGYPQTTYGQSIPRDYRYDDSNKRQRPSIGHVSQAYDQQQQNQPLPPTSRQQQQQQDWAYSQTQSGPVPYPTHSNVATSSANQGIPAPALESFNFRPHSADPHSMQPTYTGQQQHQYDSRYAAPNSASPNPHDPSRGYPDTRVNPNVQHQLHQPHQQPTTTTVVHRHAPNHTPERLQYQEMSPYPSTNNPHGNPTTRSYQPSAYYPPAVSHTTYQQ